MVLSSASIAATLERALHLDHQIDHNIFPRLAFRITQRASRNLATPPPLHPATSPPRNSATLQLRHLATRIPLTIDPDQHEPTLRTIAMPADANPSGDIFGGWLLSQMDLAGASAAIQRARGRVVTVAVD